MIELLATLHIAICPYDVYLIENTADNQSAIIAELGHLSFCRKPHSQTVWLNIGTRTAIPGATRAERHIPSGQ